MTHFVSSMGTTGTIMGVSRFLKSKSPDVRIVGLQPSEGASIAGAHSAGFLKIITKVGQFAFRCAHRGV